MGFDPYGPLVPQGAPVAPGTVNLPLRGIDQNVQYLYDLINAADTGQAIFARSVTVEATAQVGMPVWYDPQAQQFARGLAALETDAITGALLTAPSTQVWGVVYSKAGATLADLLLFGYAVLDLTAAVGGPVRAGTYYLSAQTPGGLVAQRPPVSVPVLRADGAGRVFVTPQVVDLLAAHRHYRFDLACVPAGMVEPPVPDAPHVITAPDVSRRGWLPADHPSFGGLAPAHARFGYNLAAEPALDAAWPPLPVQSATLDWDRGGDSTRGSMGVPLGIEGQAILDRNGIWWLSDCYGDVPWPTNLDTTGAGTPSDSDSLSEPGGCPREVDMALVLWFTRPDFTTEATAVTSLVTTDSRVTVACQGTGAPASTGALQVALDLAFLAQDTARAGHTVFKTFDGTTFQLGPVIEGLYALGANVTLSADVAPVEVDGHAVYQGLVGIAVTTQPTVALDALLTRLHGATEEFYQGVMYLGLPAASPASFVTRFRVPDDLEIASPQLTVRLWLLGLSSGTLPALQVTYQRLPRPTAGLVTPQALAPAPASLTITTTATLGTGNLYVEAASMPVTVAAGDVVDISVTRAAPDSYADEVGVIVQSCLLGPS